MIMFEWWSWKVIERLWCCWVRLIVVVWEFGWVVSWEGWVLGWVVMNFEFEFIGWGLGLYLLFLRIDVGRIKDS